jgi:hypothetical protein
MVFLSSSGQDIACDLITTLSFHIHHAIYYSLQIQSTEAMQYELLKLQSELKRHNLITVPRFRSHETNPVGCRRLMQKPFP